LNAQVVHKKIPNEISKAIITYPHTSENR
jgi:hypothetical protein